MATQTGSATHMTFHCSPVVLSPVSAIASICGHAKVSGVSKTAHAPQRRTHWFQPNVPHPTGLSPSTWRYRKNAESSRPTPPDLLIDFDIPKRQWTRHTSNKLHRTIHYVRNTAVPPNTGHAYHRANDSKAQQHQCDSIRDGTNRGCLFHTARAPLSLKSRPRISLASPSHCAPPQPPPRLNVGRSAAKQDERLVSVCK